ncbi:radical SAM protein [Myxococcota bacterium]|nr:radical SAM protein [Myxococcota bacterium]MBU1381581.1 radical SAM protein [Myxococcota bacterium]MBU1498855.1 radical SAM protein [Myxococcota bacterium]
MLEQLYNPEVIEIAVTSRCNFHCGHCIKQEGNIDISLDIAEKYADLASVSGIQSVCFSGGEPLLHPSLPEIINLFSSKNIHTQIITNGFLLTPELIEKLKLNGLDLVWISLDGPEEVHDKIRKKGSYLQIMDMYKLIKNAGLSVGFQTVVLKQNIDYLETLRQTIQTLNPELWFIQRGIGSGKAFISNTEAVELSHRLTDYELNINGFIIGDTLKQVKSEMCPSLSGLFRYINEDGSVSHCPFSQFAKDKHSGSFMCPASNSMGEGSGSRFIRWGNAAMIAATLAACTGNGKPASEKSDTPPSRNAVVTEPSMQVKNLNIKAPQGEAEKKKETKKIVPMMPVNPCCYSHILRPGCKCN